MKILSGAEIAGFVKERQAKQVRALRQSWKVIPKLAILQTHNDPVSDKYVTLKKQYAEDILIEIEHKVVSQSEIIKEIDRINRNSNIHALIVQLPLADPTQTDEVVNHITPEKDVDGLSEKSDFLSATAQAIDWLVVGYGIELFGKKIVIVGKGKLVGRPLADLWLAQGLNVIIADSKSNLFEILQDADVIVSAVGEPGLLTRKMIKPGAVVIDAGTTDVNGTLMGDIAEDVRDLDDISITPKIGGVGPLTNSALMDNVIRAARVVANKQGQKDLG